VDVPFTSGFRTTIGQETLQDDPTATTPATPGNSLHEAGRAFDILMERRKGVPLYSDEQLQQIVDHARQAGFNWGGDFRTPDRGHFFIEAPEGIGNRQPRIQSAQEFYQQWLNSK